MAFHLYRLLSALVHMLCLLHYIVLRGFPKYPLQYEMSLWLSALLISLPSSILQVFWLGGPVSAREMTDREMKSQPYTQPGCCLYLGLAAPFLECKAIQGKEVNSQKKNQPNNTLVWAAEGIIPSKGAKTPNLLFQ